MVPKQVKLLLAIVCICSGRTFFVLARRVSTSRSIFFGFGHVTLFLLTASFFERHVTCHFALSWSAPRSESLTNPSNVTRHILPFLRPRRARNVPSPPLSRPEICLRACLRDPSVGKTSMLSAVARKNPLYADGDEFIADRDEFTDEVSTCMSAMQITKC